MLPPSALARASRPLLRQAAPRLGPAPRALHTQPARPQPQPLPLALPRRLRPRLGAGAGSRRWQSTADGAAQQHGWFRRMWESEVGFKTVHFWAPVMKWALVLAGISDFARPAEKLSVTQNFALTCTGLIWTRWCLIIKPKNYLLAAVNFFLGIVGVIQLTRIGLYTSAQKNRPAGAVEDAKKEVEAKVKA